MLSKRQTKTYIIFGGTPIKTNNFTLLCKDDELENIISSINSTHAEDYTACHGRYHADFVANMVEYILTALSYDERTIETGKIAGLLHDIGCIDGKKEHAKRSALMCEKFLNKTDLTAAEKSIITQAIYDHSNGDNIMSPVGAALLIADKINVSKDRVLNPADSNTYHKNLLEVLQVDMSVLDSTIIINYISTDKFSPKVLFELWSKAFTVPVKAAKYLNCSCEFRINNEAIRTTTTPSTEPTT